MIKYFYTTALSAALFALASCSSDSNDEPDITPTEEPVNIVATVLKGPFEPNEIGPRMIIEADDWTIIEYRTHGEDHDEMTHLHFINPEEKASVVISGFDKGAIIYEYNMQTRRPSSEVFLTHDDGRHLVVTRCDMNWQTMEYSILSESVIELKNNRAPSRGEYEDEIRSIFIRHLDNLSGNIGDFCEAASWLSDLPVISHICAIWTDVAIPIAKYQLLEDVPESTQEYANEIITNYGTDILFSLIPSRFSGLVVKVGEITIQKVSSIYSSWRPTEKEVQESWGIMTRLSNKSHRIIQESEGYIPAYKVDLQVTGVTETSAVLNGSFTALGTSYPYIASMGYKVTGTDGYYKDISSDMESAVTIDQLTPGTEYTVTAYLNSMGHRYERTVRFYTDITLSLNPSTLLFPTAGGSRGVALSIPRENLKSWDIVSKPKWCSIEKGASSFFVEVSESKKERSGEIVVKAVTLNGKSYTASVDVQQKKASWDGTKWKCTGTIKNSFDSETFPMDFVISIRSVADNDFTINGAGAGPEDNAKIRIEGDKLVWEFSTHVNLEGVNASGTMVIVFTRTNDSALSFTLSGKVSATFEGETVNGTISGSGTGTLVTD